MSLNQIVADLFEKAEATGAAKHLMARGLALSLQRTGRQWTLTAGRSGFIPSAVELGIVADAFHVPPGTDPAAGMTYVTNLDGSTVTWHTLTWRWLEDVPAFVQPALIPNTRSYN